jgi:ATP-dependent Clp protease ATP-binding subunit ClpA
MALPINAMTPRSRRCVLRAASVAEEHGQAFIGTEHLLLALAQEVDGRPAQVLEILGVRHSVVAQSMAIVESYGAGGGLSDPGDQAQVRFGSEPLSNHPLLIDN